MNTMKSVIITLPKGHLKKDSLLSTGTKLNFTTSILTGDKLKIDNRIKQVKHMDEAMDTTILKQEPINIRGKKRRLDHLTWEEKLQRKKLKNRVAAQTSRDRKKAKLDELEETVRMLTERNDILIQECTMLRTENETLLNESERLKIDSESKKDERLCSMCQGRVDFTAPTSGSAAGWVSTVGRTSDIDAKCNRPSEDTDTLPPLEELFSELQGDDYIDRLEELAESLLREVTAEVEAHSSRPNEQISVKKETTGTPAMVDQASKNMETNSNPRGLTTTTTTTTTTTQVSHSSNGFSSNNNNQLSKNQDVKIKREPINDVDTVYGTYDEATNCITIIYPGDNDDIKIQESVQEVSTENLTTNQKDEQILPTVVTQLQTYVDHLSPFSCQDSMSPASIHSDDTDASTATASKNDSNFSDIGYESHGSPFDETVNVPETSTLTDLWHESFTELFPSLA